MERGTESSCTVIKGDLERAAHGRGTKAGSNGKRQFQASQISMAAKQYTVKQKAVRSLSQQENQRKQEDHRKLETPVKQENHRKLEIPTKQVNLTNQANPATQENRINQPKQTTLADQINPSQMAGTKRRRYHDITGQRFGMLTALYPTEKRDRDQSVVWHCRCDCGNEVEHSCGDLMRKSYISCGCLKRKAESKLKDQLTHVADTTVELLMDRKIRADSSTGVTGVTMFRGKYKARIYFQKKTYNLGTYPTLEEAAAARKAAEESLFGDFLEQYARWEEQANADPAWKKEHPFTITVERDAAGQFSIVEKFL